MHWTRLNVDSVKLGRQDFKEPVQIGEVRGGKKEPVQIGEAREIMESKIKQEILEVLKRIDRGF